MCWNNQRVYIGQIGQKLRKFRYLCYFFGLSLDVFLSMFTSRCFFLHKWFEDILPNWLIWHILKKNASLSILLPRTSFVEKQVLPEFSASSWDWLSRSDTPFLFSSIDPVPFGRLRAFESLGFSSTYRERHSDFETKTSRYNLSEIGTLI